MDRHALSQRLKAQAYGMGFDLAGITTLGEPATRARFDAWLDAGSHGDMQYLEGAGAELRRDTRRPHDGATHALVLATSYGGREASGPIARYARGDDYHDLLRERVRSLHHWLERETSQTINARPYVDSGPILERDLAQRAGLGWFGKNTMLINPRAGSFVFLSSLFVEFDLVPDAPFESDRCGTCTRCLDACPTNAFHGPRNLDATKCISYLTIELRGAIDEALRAPIGGLLYGCDICQDVCPYNVKFAAALTRDSPFAARPFLDTDARTLARNMLSLSTADYTTIFRGSAMKRAKLRGLRRNAAVVLGNIGTADDVVALATALDDDDMLIRLHAAWALGRIKSPMARATLEARLRSEQDEAVRAELFAALTHVDSTRTHLDNFSTR